MRHDISRRGFLRASAGFLAALALCVPSGSGCGSKAGEAPAGSLQEQALAVTMWEFSWLVRRSGAEAEYADWDRVLDELALRGYNCIRLDAFPHLVARGPQGDLVERFTVLPQTPLFFWGNHEPVEVEPRRSLVEFLKKMKARGMKAGLSTWFNDDTLHRAHTIVTPQDYTRIWLETLDLLAAEGLHDIIAWVDLCNEFPLGKWAKGAYPAIFNGADPDNILPALLPWSQAERSAIQSYFDEAIPPLRSAYPNLRYTFSFAGGFVGHNVTDIDTSNFDLAEVHIWLSDDPVFSLTSGQLFLLLEFPGTLERHVNTAPGVYFGDRDRWLESLESKIRQWKEWADARELPLITSESWGPINYDDVDPPGTYEEWDWVKDVCAEGVLMAMDRGWEGICTSNFCQPHFEGMWADIAWNREQASRIRGVRIPGKRM